MLGTITRFGFALTLGLLALPSMTAATTFVAIPGRTQVHFKSPSGNINCYVFATQGGVADCVVRTATWPSMPPKPVSCTLDWAPTEVQLVGAHVTLGGCRGDVGPRCYTGGDRCVVLEYGDAITTGRVRCVSSASGIACRRTVGSRPGFLIARERVLVYR
jgi:uncharacterized protein DUF6636